MLLLFAWFSLTSCAWTHPLDLGYLTVHTEKKTLTAALELNPEMVQKLFGRDAESALLADTPRASGERCVWGSATVQLLAQRQAIRIESTARCPIEIRELKWQFPFLQRAPRTYQLLVRVYDGRSEHSTVLEPKQDTLLTSLAMKPTFSRFFGMGVEHIGAAPDQWRGSKGWHLPDGIDHILFLFALILAGSGIVSMLATVTGFTVGHSVTLCLATLGWVHLPGRLVESAIAVSIVYVAAEDLLVKHPRHRWRIAVVFGLIHGFGFASALTELQLGWESMAKALVGFNVGVEVGQAVIVAILAPIVLGFKVWLPRFSSIGIAGCCGAIFLVGIRWFFLRAWG